MNEDRKKEIIRQIEELEKELYELSIEAKSMGFVKLLRAVLLTDKCYITLQGHEEWQFTERYYMNDISYDMRKEIVRAINKIETDKENEKWQVKKH